MASGSKKVIIAALAGNSAIAVAKFIGAGISGSAAMVAEGIHSLVDTSNQVLLLYGLKQSDKPADKNYPFGRGKEIYFWSFVVAMLIFVVGGGLAIYHGVEHLLHAHGEPGDPTVSYIVLVLAIIFESWVLWVAVKEFNRVKGDAGYVKAVQRSKDPALFVVLFEDAAALSGLVVALIGVTLTQITGDTTYDAIASLVIGALLVITALWLAIETKSLLVGEAANPEVEEALITIAAAAESVEKVNEVHTLHMGSHYVLATMSVEFKDDISIQALEQSIADIDAKIKAQHPDVKHLFIEAEDFANHVKA